MRRYLPVPQDIDGPVGGFRLSPQALLRPSQRSRCAIWLVSVFLLVPTLSHGQDKHSPNVFLSSVAEQRSQFDLQVHNPFRECTPAIALVALRFDLAWDKGFTDFTFLETYKGRILAAVGLCLLQFVFIGYLLIERSRRRAANERLLASRAQLAKTFQFNPQPMSLTTQLDGRYLDVNESFLRMSGYTKEEVIGRTSTELNIWDTPGTRHELVKRVAERGSLRNTETRFRTKTGAFRTLFSSIETLNIDGEPCLLFASSDITERKLAEDRFRRFFDLPLVGMAITSPTRRFLIVNQTLCQMLGYSPEELTQMSWTEVTHPDDIAENVRLLDETIRGETEGYMMDKRFIHRDGRIIYTSLSARCVRDEDGSIDQLVLIVQDITERKQAEQWLSELTGRLLRYQDEERRRIARELHDGTAQGIGVILLNLARVKRAAASLDAGSQDRLTECITLGEEALKDIRTLSYVLHPPLLDQAGLSTALHWYVKGFSERSGVKVDFVEVGDDGHRMPPDVEYSLFRVVQECLTNIRRHTNSETATISLTRTSDTVILQVQDFGTHLEVETRCNGEGIESLGVGIPGMRHRLRQLGGDLEVKTTTQGTTVTATVPVKWVNYDPNTVS